MSPYGSPPTTLLEFDRCGFILGIDETIDDLRQRWQDNAAFNSHIQKQIDETGSFTIFNLHYDADMRLNAEQLQACQRPVIESYHCQTPWVPAFFCNKGLSFIFGGMALGFKDSDGLVQKDGEFSLFQLRSSFREKEKFLIYTRTEIVAHESCHIARMPLKAQKYEELLAYRISESGFRRCWGSIIRRPLDVLLFFITILLCLLSQVADIIYHPALAISLATKAPLFLLVIFLSLRNWSLHRAFGRAGAQLKAEFGTNSDAVLFRLSDEEIDSLAAGTPWAELNTTLSTARREIIDTFKTEDTTHG